MRVGINVHSLGTKGYHFMGDRFRKVRSVEIMSMRSVGEDYS